MNKSMAKSIDWLKAAKGVKAELVKIKEPRSQGVEEPVKQETLYTRDRRIRKYDWELEIKYN